MPSPIPDAWREQVVAILRSGRRIFVVGRARDDWEAAFPDDFLQLTLYDAMADALCIDGVLGKQHVMDEPGGTWAFFFIHRRAKLYGKICLTPEGDLIVIYSAHRPLKGEEL